MQWNVGWKQCLYAHGLCNILVLRNKLNLQLLMEIQLLRWMESCFQSLKWKRDSKSRSLSRLFPFFSLSLITGQFSTTDWYANLAIFYLSNSLSLLTLCCLFSPLVHVVQEQLWGCSWTECNMVLRHYHFCVIAVRPIWRVLMANFIASSFLCMFSALVHF